LRNASGNSLITMSPKCPILRRNLAFVRWKGDVNGNPVADLDKSDPALSHMSEALDCEVRVLLQGRQGYGDVLVEVIV